GEHAAVAKATDLAGIAFHDLVAHRDLAVAPDRDAAVTAYTKNRRAVKFAHRPSWSAEIAACGDGPTIEAASPPARRARAGVTARRSRRTSPLSAAGRADVLGRRCGPGAGNQGACRPASSTGSHDRAAPAPRAGRRSIPADASRTSAAACPGARGPAHPAAAPRLRLAPAPSGG